jgi:glycosyltransferase involved in cell wall biosynthesis
MINAHNDKSANRIHPEDLRKRPLFSAVIPVYNSERSLNELSKRLVDVFEKEMNVEHEIIFVDDASKDQSWDVLKKIKRTNTRIVVIRLSRNFGQHNATMCGFNHCRGEFVVTLDDDLQHPPEEIPKLYQRLTETGADVVIGCPEKKRHSIFRNLGSLFIDRAYRRIFDKPPEIYIGSFRMIKEWVVKELVLNKSPNPMIGGIILQTTHNIANERLAHCKRAYGSSNYKFEKIIKIVLDLFINFSTIPLKIVSGCGTVFFIMSVIAGLYIIGRKILGLITIPGWASIMVLFLFFSGLNMIVLGVVGEYLARIIKEVTYAKQYLIREQIDGSKADD